MLKSKVNTASFRKELRKKIPDVKRRAVEVLDLAQREAVDYAKGYGNETAPEVYNSAGDYIPKSKQKTRKLHHGGWGDVTHNLRDSIQTGEITVTSRGAKTEFGVEQGSGAMEYAEILDARDGIDVLGGADEVAKKALKKHGEELLT